MLHKFLWQLHLIRQAAASFLLPLTGIALSLGQGAAVNAFGTINFHHAVNYILGMFKASKTKHRDKRKLKN